MESGSVFEAAASALVERGGPVADLGIGGHFDFEVYDGETGALKRKWRAKNGWTNAALNDVLNVYLRNGTPAAAVYMGLISNSGYTALAAADTMASHAGWSESSAYTNATRPAWAPDAASGQAVTNSTQVSFTINGGVAVALRGAFIATDGTKGGSSGTLVCTAAFTEGVQTLNPADVLKVTYTATAAAV